MPSPRSFLHGREVTSVVALVFGVLLCLLPLRLDPNLSFQDTRTVTHSIQCVQQGLDPYVDTCDPWKRVFNYPPIWLQLGKLGIGPQQTNLVGVLLALSTLATLLYLFRATSPWRRVLAVLAYFSYPVFFGMKEGNIDQSIFALLVLGGAALGSLRRTRSAVLIVLLAVLKVFPLAAVAVFVRTRHAAAKIAATVVVGILAMYATAGTRLMQAILNTPHDTLNSFGGYTTLMLTLRALLGGNGPPEKQVAHAALVLFGVVGLAVFAACALQPRRIGRFFPAVTGSSREATAVAGMAIFCVVFVASSSYAYRLLFLLPALALLLDDTSSTASSRRVLPATSLFFAGLLLPYVYQRPYLHTAIFLVSLVHAALFLVCVAWLAVVLRLWPAQPVTEDGGSISSARKIRVS